MYFFQAQFATPKRISVEIIISTAILPPLLLSTPICKSKIDSEIQNFSGKDTRNISIVAKKWVRISQYETNTKRGKKIMDKLKMDFEAKAFELCASKGKYNVLEKRIEVLEFDETPAYGLETKVKLGINGVVECI